MKRFCLTLKLKNDPELIKEYDEHHKAVWPDVISSIKEAGIESMEIFRYGTVLLMIMEVNDNFSFGKKQQDDTNNEKVQQWEQLMLKYQQPFEDAANNEKWILMNKIFDLKSFD